MNINKQKTIINFKKAQGFLKKILQMVQEDKYCIDIMQQNLAIIGLLKSAHLMLMKGHFETCFKKAAASKNGKRKEQMVEEILKVTSLFNR